LRSPPRITPTVRVRRIAPPRIASPPARVRAPSVGRKALITRKSTRLVNRVSVRVSSVRVSVSVHYGMRMIFTEKEWGRINFLFLQRNKK